MIAIEQVSVAILTGGVDRSSPLRNRTKIVPGYCSDCGEQVEIECYTFWMGLPGQEPSDTCLKCGGHNVTITREV